MPESHMQLRIRECPKLSNDTIKEFNLDRKQDGMVTKNKQEAEEPRVSGTLF